MFQSNCSTVATSLLSTCYSSVHNSVQLGQTAWSSPWQANSSVASHYIIHILC